LHIGADFRLPVDAGYQPTWYKFHVFRCAKLDRMPYPEILIKPMREDLTRFGVEETRTPEEVDQAVRETNGTLMIVVNSVCGCAAGLARPAIGMALKHNVVPDKVITVFAGGDVEATQRARGYFKGYFPSSPSVGLLQNGQIVFMLERHQIEGRDPVAIAKDLTAAFDRFCVPVT
jgi:putative YphP/YqiW family bacilliredoxin